MIKQNNISPAKNHQFHRNVSQGEQLRQNSRHIIQKNNCKHAQFIQCPQRGHRHQNF